MLTNPSTLGLFEERIVEIADIFHDAGALLYYDGANLNAVCGISRPGDMGFDIIHYNLHKTFSQPHGGGGPGGGPVAVRDSAGAVPAGSGGRPRRRRLPPRPRPAEVDRPGARVLRAVRRVRARLRVHAHVGAGAARDVRAGGAQRQLPAGPAEGRLRDCRSTGSACTSSCSPPAASSAITAITALDVAKRLMDHGFHPPTVYFPLIVPEALMIEPTETETLETLDAFCDAMLAIAREAADDPQVLKTAPHSRPVTRLDEAAAAKRLVVRHRFDEPAVV